MIYLLYGQPASGKTTLGKMLEDHLNTPFTIDGDEFREMFTNKNYGREGREENIKNANAVATYLNKKGINKFLFILLREVFLQASKGPTPVNPNKKIPIGVFT